MWKIRQKGINKVLVIIVEIAGMILSVISIIVTVISIRHTTKKGHQKSNRQRQR